MVTAFDGNDGRVFIQGLGFGGVLERDSHVRITVNDVDGALEARDLVFDVDGLGDADIIAGQFIPIGLEDFRDMERIVGSAQKASLTGDLRDHPCRRQRKDRFEGIGEHASDKHREKSALGMTA